MKKNEKKEIKYFNDLNLDWVLDSDISNTNIKSGQAKVLFVKHKLTGQKGVFRKLRSKNPKSIERFHRELEILTKLKSNHQNLINIIDYTGSDQDHWYISEKGGSVQEFKIKIREELRNSPDDLIQLCAKLIYDLADGLSIVHEKGIIHRDIKPDNIVVVNGRLVLIDFGLAFSPFEDRISNPEEATGNSIFSHDHQRRFIDDPKPWLDVFMLSQLLIWFTEESGSKNWFRPLDWRFVQFIDGISESNYLSLRAITALCSEISISPTNAQGFKELLEEKFMLNKNETTYHPKKINFDIIQEGINKGQNVKSISSSIDRQIITSSFPIAHSVFQDISGSLEVLYNTLINSNIKVSRNKYDLNQNHNDRLEMTYDLYLNGVESSSNAELLEWHFGLAANKNFHFRVMSMIYSPSIVQRISSPCPPKELNIFTFFFQLYSNDVSDRERFPFQTKVLTIKNNGELMWWDEHYKHGEIVLLSQVISQVQEWMENPIAWELIQ